MNFIIQSIVILIICHFVHPLCQMSIPFAKIYLTTTKFLFCFNQSVFINNCQLKSHCSEYRTEDEVNSVCIFVDSWQSKTHSNKHSITNVYRRVKFMCSISSNYTPKSIAIRRIISINLSTKWTGSAKPNQRVIYWGKIIMIRYQY